MVSEMGFCEVCNLEYPSHQPHENKDQCIEKLKERIEALEDALDSDEPRQGDEPDV